MTEYISGYPPVVESYLGQLRTLHAVGGLLIGGDAVRAAMYETYGWPDAPSFALEFDARTGALIPDIDVFAPYGPVAVPREARQGPAYVDTSLNDLLGHPASFRLGGFFHGQDISVCVGDQRAMAPREYRLGDTPVRGLRPDTQYYAEHMLTPPVGVGGNKYRASRTAFGLFVRWLSAEHPKALEPSVSHEAFQQYRGAEGSIPHWTEG